MASRIKIADIYAALSVDGLTQFDGSMDKAEARAKKAADQIAKVGHALLGMGAALTALTAMMVKEAAEDEKLQQRLSILFGSATAGAKAFEKLERRARETGESTTVLTDAVQALNVYFKDSPELIMKLLPRLQDLAAFMGKDLPTVIQTFGRALTGGLGDAVALREPAFAKLLKDFAETRGVTLDAKMGVEAFRAVLMNFLTSPEAKWGDFAAKSAKTFSGQLAILRRTVEQLAAKFGEVLLPPLTAVVGFFTKVAEWIMSMPSEGRTVIAWVVALTAAFGTLSGTLLALIPRILATKIGLATLVTEGSTLAKVLGVAKAIGFGGSGLLGALAALAFLMYMIDVNSRGAGQAARDLAAGGGKDLEKRIETITGMLKEEYARKLADRRPALIRTLEFALDGLRSDLAALNEENKINYQTVANGTEQEKANAAALDARRKALAGVFDQLYELNQLEKAEQERRLRALGETPEVFDPTRGIDFDVVLQVRQNMAEAEEKAKKLAAVMAELGLSKNPLLWTSEDMAAFNKAMAATDKGIDWFGALQQAAGAAGQSIGRAFADMAAGAEVSIEKVIIQVVKLIAKLLIMAALYAIPGVGPILSQFAGGFMGAVGFDNPVSDSQAFRWGMDFSRQFGAGVNSMLGNGLMMPQMQPAAIGGMGGVAFDVHVHNAGPDTYVNIVRKGVASMGSQDRLGVMRDGLGRAYDDWNGR